MNICITTVFSFLSGFLVLQPKDTTQEGKINRMVGRIGAACLTATPALYDTGGATAKSVVGIATPKLQGDPKTPNFLCVFFYGRVPSVMVGSTGQLRLDRFLGAVVATCASGHPNEIATSFLWLTPLSKERAIMPQTISPRPVASNSISCQIQTHIGDLLALSEAIAYLDPRETPDGTISSLAFIQLNKLETLENLINDLGVAV
ncbi:MAG: hypothetical protein JKY93_01865 [Gammaproteobacteria bacterium]|nr:hypothetical protein [Gammaproteobacteria bacterium]